MGRRPQGHRDSPGVVDPSRAAATTTGASVARSGAWNLTGNALPQVYLLAISIAAARFLHPHDFGRQSFIAFVALSLVTLLATGLATGLSRYVGASLGARNQDEVRLLVRLASRLAWLAAAAATITLVTIGVAGGEPRAAWILAGVAAGLSVLQQEQNAVLTGFQRWREVTIAGLAVGALTTVVVIAVLAAGGGISGIFAVEAAAGAVFLAWTALLAHRALRSLARGGGEGAPTRQMLRYAAITTVGVVLTLVVWRRSEFFFLNHYSTDDQIGFYSIAFAAAAALVLLPTSIAGVLLPSIATLYGAGELDRIRVAYARGGRLLLVLSLPLVAAGLALGPELLVLVYGSAYEDAGILLVIMLIPVPVLVLGLLARVVLAATGQLVFQTAVGVVAAGLNLALDFALIPRYDAVGAAVANSIAQLASSVPVFIYVQRLLGQDDRRLLSLSKAALSAAAGGLVAWLCVLLLGGIAGVVVGFVAGGAAFLALAGAVGMLSADDAQWLDGAVGGAFGGRVGRMVRFCGQPTPSRTL